MERGEREEERGEGGNGGRKAKRKERRRGRGREDKGEGGGEAERGEYIASTCKARWGILATYSEQPCNVRCMSSIHTSSRAWHTLTRLGGLWRVVCSCLVK